MKKIFAILIALMLVFCLHLSAYAAEGEEVTTPTEEIVTEGENSAEETVPEKPITEFIVEYLQTNYEEIIVIVFTFLFGIFAKKMKNQLTGSIGTLNNNAVTIAENSATAIQSTLSKIEDVTKVMNEQKEEFAALLKHVDTSLKTVKLAALEMSNEVAELLILANIPNSKKDELYARHTKAVRDLEKVEEEGNNGNTEG